MKRATLKLAFLAVAAIAASVALAGCEDILNSLLDNGAPTGVNASDGDYADSIHVSWAAPSLSSEQWAGYGVSHYELSWSSAGDSGWADNVPSTSYSIQPVDRAEYYDITVTAVLSGGPLTGGSASDTGFAMDASPLIWNDGGSVNPMAATEQWYVTMLQKGFSYSFDFNAPNTGTVKFYPFKSLDIIHGPIIGETPTWTCDDNGKGNKFYLRITTGSPSFTATCDYGY